MELSDVELRDLCEAERVALQRVALEQLNTLSLGCHIQLPKGKLTRQLVFFCNNVLGTCLACFPRNTSQYLNMILVWYITESRPYQRVMCW